MILHVLYLILSFSLCSGRCATEERSNPSLALSTFLLHHLPVSHDDHTFEESPSSDRRLKKPAIAYFSLPLENGYSCPVHAVLVRNSLNTITAVLKTEFMVVNRCPWEVELVELISGENKEKEALWGGKVLVGETIEKRVTLGVGEEAVCVQKQVSVSDMMYLPCSVGTSDKYMCVIVVVSCI